MDPYVNITALERQFGSFHLGPISLELAEKDYLVLLGTTGCGKTSLLRCIVGIAGKISSSIFLGGRDIGLLPPRQRHIGYVSQASDLFPHLTVRENIAFGLAYRRLSGQEKQQKVDRYLDLFGLSRQGDQPVATLSGGENKRTGMARSLIIGPSMLLLDEPLAMLDQNGRKAMLETLKIIHEELRTTTVHVTHDRHEAWRIAKQCAVMDRGRIIQTGSVQDLFRKPKSRFVADFLGGTNIFNATFEGKRAQLGWIDFTLSAPVCYPKGWVLIRPELIRIDREKKGSKLSGVVKGIHDFGEYLEMAVAATNPAADDASPDTAELKVHVPLSAVHPVGLGQQVFLHWQDEDVHAFPDDGLDD